jgi:hypothetical protein
MTTKPETPMSVLYVKLGKWSYLAGHRVELEPGVPIGIPRIVYALLHQRGFRYIFDNALDRDKGAVTAILPQILQQNHRLRIDVLQSRAG